MEMDEKLWREQVEAEEKHGFSVWGPRAAEMLDTLPLIAGYARPDRSAPTESVLPKRHRLVIRRAFGVPRRFDPSGA